jgi:hypothetical protein
MIKNEQEGESRRYNIYYGNHGKRHGIEDYLTILQSVLSRHGYSVEESANLIPGAVNIIIDEFTNYIENRRISEFKKAHPGTIFIFVLTEFIEKKHFVRSINHFGGILDSAVISFLNVLIRRKRDDYRPARLQDWGLLTLYLPILSLYGAAAALRYALLSAVSRKFSSRFLDRFKSHLHKLAYFHMRYLGLEEYIKYADLILTSHECIESGVVAAGWLKPHDPKFIGVLYPEFAQDEVVEKIFVGKSLHIEITGSITPYRQRYIDKYNKLLGQIFIFGLKNIHTLGQGQAIQFGNPEDMPKTKRAAYSFHPPQTANWPYSSPMRLFRALNEDRNIPIITHYYGQNPIEELCLRFEGIKTLVKMIEFYNDKDAMLDFLKPRIEKYNIIARNHNDEIMSSLRKL